LTISHSPCQIERGLKFCHGVDQYVVQRILGHKTAAMTQRYAHLAPDNLRAGLNTLDFSGTAIVGYDGDNEGNNENI
jgi:hypothetical protein